MANRFFRVYKSNFKHRRNKMQFVQDTLKDRFLNLKEEISTKPLQPRVQPEVGICVIVNEFKGLCATPRLLKLAALAGGTSFPKQPLQAQVTLTLYYLGKPLLLYLCSHLISDDLPT